MNKYSCIFYDFNETLDDPHDEIDKLKKYINKFTRNDFFSNNEIHISNTICKMINHEKYFYIPEKIEKINFINVENSNEDDEMDNYEINNYKINNYKINNYKINNYKIKNEKINNEKIKNNNSSNNSSNNFLLKYKNNKFVHLDDYLFFNNSFSNNKFYFHQMMIIYKKLLKSIYMLNENNIFYNNINLHDVLISPSNLPIISNFSFSIIMDKSTHENIKKFILDYDPSYSQWPIEIHLLAYIFHHKNSSISTTNAERIVSDLIDNNSIFNNFSENVKQKYYDDGIHFLNNFINMKTNDIIKFVILQFKFWDNYSLSFMYLEIIIKIYKSMKNKNNKFIINFMKLLMKNTSFNPKNRLSIKNTRKVFEQLIYDISQNEYKEIIDALCDS
jgi:hypothetical protein